MPWIDERMFQMKKKIMTFVFVLVGACVVARMCDGTKTKKTPTLVEIACQYCAEKCGKLVLQGEITVNQLQACGGECLENSYGDISIAQCN
jgi:hypothetical protein